MMGKRKQERGEKGGKILRNMVFVNSNNDVVIYWTMTGITLYRIDSSSMIGTHQLHRANPDMIPGENIFTLNRSFNEYSMTSRQPSIRADYSS